MAHISRLRRLTGGLIVFLSLLVPGWALAQDDAGLPTPVIAVIDQQAILQEAAAARAVRAQMEKQVEAYQKEIADIEGKLREASNRLEQQRQNMKPQELQAKMQEFQKRYAEAQRTVQERKRVLDEAFARAMGQIQNALAEVVREIAKERGINLLLDRSQTLVVASSMDVSHEALARLNQRIQSVELKLEAPEPSGD